MNNSTNKTFSFVLVAIAFLLSALTFTAQIYFPNISSHVFAIASLAYLAICIVYLIIVALRNRAAYAKNQDILSHLLENVGAMVVIWDKNLKCIAVNTTFVELTGYSATDLCNMGSVEKHAKGISDDFPRLVREQGTITNTEITILCKDGTSIASSWNTSLISSGSQKLYISVGTDVTKDFEMQEKLYAFSKDLAETESRYALSMELSEIGLLLKKTDSDNFFVSEQLQIMLGISSDFIKVGELRERIHPKDRPLYEACCRLDEADAEEKKRVHSIELRIISSCGMYRWYEFRYKISVGENGESNLGGAVIDVTKDKEKDSLIERMAYIDDVTQIYNRNKFLEIGQETFNCSVELGFSYWLIILDIDRFHIINDTCGYQNGNDLLKRIAGVIVENIEQIGFGARIGGDNFSILIRDDGNEMLPVKIINTIQTQIATLAEDVFATQTITCSAGYCKMPEDADNFAKAIDHAEFALSLNDDSRGTVIRYNGKMHDNILAGNAIEKELEKALANNELVLYYQPKINLSNGEIFGMEALIRWIKPNGQILPPSVFIPVAEKSLLITKISSFVLREACRQNKEWQDKGMPKIAVSVNLTSTDFYQTDVKEEMSKVLAETGLEPKYLEIELTESLALKDIEQAVHQMNELKKLGVKLSMDDFGTGYSSLSYIQILPITLLKLDRSFVMYLEDDEVSREIVSAVIRIAKSKQIETIAEGIETKGQADILQSSGCDLAQGYFFGKPMPADEFEKYVMQKTAVKN